MRLALLLALAGLHGCIDVGAFACEPGACDLDAREGICEPEGWCSYPDDDCESRRRFERRAPGSLGGACVEPAGTSTAGTTAVLSSSSSESTESSSTGDATGSVTTGEPACDGHGCGWTSVESGALHTCAVDGNGAVWCWGLGPNGELGTGDNPEFRNCPQAPAGTLVGQEMLAVGGHTCSATSDALHCWGPNGLRQIDWSQSAARFLEPHLVDLRTREPIRAIGTGDNLTCVGISDTLLCWGRGALTVDETNAPAAINVVGVGNDHVCGMLDDDSLWCFGSDARGQLGGGPGDQSPSPVQPDLAGDAAIQLSVGAQHSCAITEGDGSGARKVKCWGDNRSNQAGGIVNQVELPRDVSGDLVPGEWVDVAAGVLHSCAINADGEVWCWGGNEYGQVDPHAENLSLLRTASKIELDPVVDAVDIAVATTITCALDRDALWWCWGCLEPGQLVNSGTCTVSPPTLFEPCG